MKKIWRGIAGGVACGIVSEIFGGLIYGMLFLKQCEQISVWRSMESWQMRVGMPLVDIFGGLMVALGYAFLYKGIPGQGIKKGLMFGLIFWLIMRVPGELFGYVMSPIPFKMVIIGWLHGFLTMSLGGIIIAAVYGKSLEEVKR